MELNNNINITKVYITSIIIVMQYSNYCIRFEMNYI